MIFTKVRCTFQKLDIDIYYSLRFTGLLFLIFRLSSVHVPTGSLGHVNDFAFLIVLLLSSCAEVCMLVQV